MLAVCRLNSGREWRSLTLKELVIRYDATVLNEWDRTATLAALLYNVQATVINCNTKSRIKPKTIFDFHPFREKKLVGLKVSPKNISVLRMLGKALVRGG